MLYFSSKLKAEGRTEYCLFVTNIIIIIAMFNNVRAYPIFSSYCAARVWFLSYDILTDLGPNVVAVPLWIIVGLLLLVDDFKSPSGAFQNHLGPFPGLFFLL